MNRHSGKQQDAKVADVPKRDSQQIKDLIEQLERDLQQTKRSVRKSA